MTVIKVVKNQIKKKVYLPLNQLGALVFFFFTHTTKNQSRTTQYPAVERRHDQHKVNMCEV